MALYGLIGKDISYSFSKRFFMEEFERKGLKHQYENFDIPSIESFPNVLEQHPTLKGLNVTIPYKESILPYLDKIDEEAQAIGAVNTIKIKSSGKLIGYNTDHYGFAKALEPFIPLSRKTALILGTGGAAKAITYVLDVMGFEYHKVSRTPSEGMLSYQDLNQEIIQHHALIINCTPLGTHPNVMQCPPIPYIHLHKEHLLFDLIYNPATTEFLKRGFAQGTRISNGLEMLEQQAKKAWRIWNT